MPSRLQRQQQAVQPEQNTVMQDAMMQAFGSNQDRIAALNQRQGNTGPDQMPLHQQRGELARKQGRLTYQAGRETHGKGSWETQGSNRGPHITPIKEHLATGRHEWCDVCGAATKRLVFGKRFSQPCFIGYRLHVSHQR